MATSTKTIKTTTTTSNEQQQNSARLARLKPYLSNDSLICKSSMNFEKVSYKSLATNTNVHRCHALIYNNLTTQQHSIIFKQDQYNQKRNNETACNNIVKSISISSFDWCENSSIQQDKLVGTRIDSRAPHNLPILTLPEHIGNKQKSRTLKSHDAGQSSQVNLKKAREEIHTIGRTVAKYKMNEVVPTKNELVLLTRLNTGILDLKPRNVQSCDSIVRVAGVVCLTLAVLLSCTVPLHVSSSESPVRLLRNRTQQQQFVSTLNISSNVTPASPVEFEPEIELLLQGNKTSSTASGSTLHDENERHSKRQAPALDECPAIKQRLSLLPPELYSNIRANSYPAYCECSTDLLGWHMTCFSTGGTAPFQTSNRGAVAAAALAAASASSVDSSLTASIANSQKPGSGHLPNQLHPAFREPQLQFQRQQQAVRNAIPSSGTSINEPNSRIRRAFLGDFYDESDAMEAESSSYLGTTGSDEFAAPNMSSSTANSIDVELANLSVDTTVGSTADMLLSRSTKPSSQKNSHQKLARRQMPNNRKRQQSSSLSSSVSDEVSRDFHSVPVLFSIKYIRNNMIEIDCDQAAPSYKPAMFQGFNVDEISSFSFNNCQLPNIPFSVLLHRKRTLPTDASLTASISRHSSQNSRAANSKLPEQIADNLANVEPSVRSLTISLNAIVEQRTLISLLTSLDQLEELHLNYLQLDLSNVKLSYPTTHLQTDLDTRPSTSTPAMASSSNSLSSSSVLSSTATQIMLPTTTNNNNLQQHPTSPKSSASITSSTRAPEPLQQPSTSSSLLSSTTSTSSPQLIATPISGATFPLPSSPANLAPTTIITTATRGANRTNTTAPLTTASHLIKPTTIQATTSTTTTNPTTTQQTTPKHQTVISNSASATIATTQQQKRLPTTAISSSSKPTTLLGGRGLAVAQATGVPINANSEPQTTPVTTTMLVTYPTGTNAGSASQTSSRQPQSDGSVSVASIQSSSVSFSSSSNQPTQRGSNIAQTSLASNRQPPTTHSTRQSQTTSLRSPTSANTDIFLSAASHDQSLPLTSSASMTPPPAVFGSRNPTTASNGFASLAGTSDVTSANLLRNNKPLTVTPTTLEISASTPFVAAGNRLSTLSSSVLPNNPRQRVTQTVSIQHQTNNQQINRNKPTTTIATSNAPRDQTMETLSRSKRQVPSLASTREDLELSFGDLLPNLRILKLESFIDLHTAVAKQQQQQNNKLHETSGSRNIRFKRQFASDDEPGLDSGHMTDEEEAETLLNNNDNDDSLASESNSSSMLAAVPLPDKIASRSSVSSPALAEDDNSSEMIAMPATNNSSTTTTATSTNDQQPQISAEWRASSEVISEPIDELLLERASSYVLVKLFSKLRKLRMLHLSANEIPRWPDDVLQDSRRSLQRLYLISNNIRSMSNGCLLGFSELEIVDLSKNQLRSLSDTLFVDLVSLRGLRARRNLFRRLPGKLFSMRPLNGTTTTATTISAVTNNLNHHKLTRLENVDFSQNKFLSMLAWDLFASPHQNTSHLIANLTLNECNLTDSSFFTQQQNNKLATNEEQIINFFATLPELRTLSMQSNKFRRLLKIPGLFARNMRLEKVDVSQNLLTNVAGNLFNSNASQLVELYLQKNKLDALPAQSLFYLRKLRKLVASHNRLEVLDANLFINSQQLEHLDLSYNFVKTIATHKSNMLPFGLGTNLKIVNLAHNKLVDFDGDFVDINWQFYAKLTLLDLSNNLFSGQISMPIFYIISKSLNLNLAQNNIQNINVDELMQHEQRLETFAAYEAVTETPSADEAAMSNGYSKSGEFNNNNQAAARSSKQKQLADSLLDSSSSSTQKQHPPTVFVTLTQNPIVCDCLLEPLVSYSRKIAAASNQALVESLFASTNTYQTKPLTNLAKDSSLSQDSQGSKYSVLRLSASDSSLPQVFYKFKFTDLYCAEPQYLRQQLLSHVSIGDLLCPVRELSLCPELCSCSYQSAFKTLIVDCSDRRLTKIPKQLMSAKNFELFNIETSFNLSLSSNNNSQQTNSIQTLIDARDKLSKIIIRLDKNELRQIDGLKGLFTLIKTPPPSALPSHTPDQLATDSLTAASSVRSRFTRVVNDLSSTLSSTTTTTTSTSTASPDMAKKKSPVAVGRFKKIVASALPTVSRSRRQIVESDMEQPSMTETSSNDFSSKPGAKISTTVLESAEELQQNVRKFPLSCELYLDHNLISEIPEDFLEFLDKVRQNSVFLMSSMFTSFNDIKPPQAALPTHMLEPPIHTKLSHVHMIPTSHVLVESASQPSISKSISGETPTATDLGDEPMRLFGAHPNGVEKKAALRETIQQNLKLQQEQQASNSITNHPPVKDQPKLSISPALIVLSLRYNNITKIDAKLLVRLGKLVKLSNAKLYLGHNPFNCTENRAQPSLPTIAPTTGSTTITTTTASPSDNMLHQPRDLYASNSPYMSSSLLDDRISESRDVATGAYLETDEGDTIEANESSLDAFPVSINDSLTATKPQQQATSRTTNLMPSDCPIGQFKSWISQHHSYIGDLDELYCVHMPADLAGKLKVPQVTVESSSNKETSSRITRHTNNANQNTWTHSHPWAPLIGSSSGLLSPRGYHGYGGGLVLGSLQVANNSVLFKNGLEWNPELLMQTAKLIDLDMNDLCPYSGNQINDPSPITLFSRTSQQVLLGTAVIFIVISCCLLMMLIYFGDTQTILAFVYIHLHPLYGLLHLSESKLDADKLYDAFVSYSSADRDIVMELIDKLERMEFGFDETSALIRDSNSNCQGKQNSKHNSKKAPSKLLTSKGIDLDNSKDVLVKESDVISNSASASINGTTGKMGTLRQSSFEDLGTISRSNSRLSFGHSNNNSNNNLTTLAEHDFRTSPSAINNGFVNEQSKGYKLCIHERDWLPGHLISWNIVNSVQNSRRTILVLSKDFIKSIWFQIEFHTAYYQMLEDKIDRLIVIVRGELPPKNELDKDLAFLLTTKTYLTWGEKWFWERLHYALPHKSCGPQPRISMSKKQLKQQLHQHNYQNTSCSSMLFSKNTATSTGDNKASSNANLNQQTLLMSTMGKDCSNLLSCARINTNNNIVGGRRSPLNESSSSSSTSSSTATTTSATSNNNLISNNNNSNMTSAPKNIATTTLTTITANTTKVTIGNTHQSADSGAMSTFTSSMSSVVLKPNGVSGTPTSTSATSSSMSSSAANGITSIMLDGRPTKQTTPTAAIGLNDFVKSKVQAKKQRELQNYVDKSISSHFDLSDS